MGVRDHFTEAEWKALGVRQQWDRIDHLSMRNLEEFEEAETLHNLRHYCRQYVLCLAFYQRIQMPLDHVVKRVNAANMPERWPLSAMPNFQELQSIVSRQFGRVLNPLEATEAKKAELMCGWEKLALQLWFAGYGILPGFGLRTTDNTALEALYDCHACRQSHSPRYKEPLEVLGMMLSNEPASPVENPSIGTGRRPAQSVFELETVLWQAALSEYPGNQAVGLLYEYIFGELKGRTEGRLFREYPALAGTGGLIREGLAKLDPSTWRSYAGRIRVALPAIAQYSVAQLLEGQVSEVLRQMSLNLEPPQVSAIKFLVRGWLDWYTKTKGMPADVDRAVPRSRKHVHKRFGKIVDPVAASVLIDHILNQPTAAIRENRIVDYRCRRAVLIMLSTGARITQTLNLKADCLKVDKFGNRWIHFHHSKTDEPYKAWAEEDLVQWIRELQKFAPRDPLYFPSDTGFGGDGLTEYRLFADAADKAPLNQQAVKDFMTRLQDHIWPDGPPKGKYFTPHDLRRLQANYLVLAGFSPEQIAVKLGHRNITSQIPYTANGDPRNARDFALMLKDDIYGLSAEPEECSVNLATLLHHNATLAYDQETARHWAAVLERALEDTKDVQIATRQDALPAPTATGYPLALHNCHAPAHYNCGSAPIHCLACSHYHPDDDKLRDHLALVLRQMIGCLHHEALAQHHRETGKRVAVYIKVTGTADGAGNGGLKGQINRAFTETFASPKGYRLGAPAAERLRGRLWQVAKRWYRANGKDLKEPQLSQIEAIALLGTVEVPT